jgi:hypothetical protein
LKNQQDLELNNKGVDTEFSLALAFWIERPSKSSSILLKTTAFSDVDFNIHSSNLILLFFKCCSLWDTAYSFVEITSFRVKEQ